MPPLSRPAILAASMSRRAGILGFPAVNRLHVQRVAERERDRLVLAQIGEPIPGEHTFAADDQAGAKGRDSAQERLGPCRQIAGEHGAAGVVEHVGEHAPGVQINAAVKCVGAVVETHGYLLESPRGMSRVDPASWLPAHRRRLKDPRWTALRRRVRFTWDVRLILRGDRRGIQSLHPTAAALRSFGTLRLTSGRRG